MSALSDAIIALSPTAYYKLDEIAGSTTAVDSSGSGLDGTKTGSCTFGNAIGIPGAAGDTAIKNASSGGADGINLPNNAAWTFPGDLTFAFWGKTTFSAAGPIVPIGLNAQNTTISNGHYGSAVMGTVNIADGALHFFVCRRIGSTFSVFIDGVLDASGTDATVFGDGTLAALMYLPAAGAYGSQMTMGHAAFWKGTGLSNSDITTISNAGFGVTSMVVAANLSDASNTDATTVQVSSATPVGGSGIYTYAWHKSTTAGFTPGPGTLVAGQTSQTATFSGLTAHTNYWIKCVVSDGTTTATSFQRLINAEGLAPVIFGAIGDSTGVTPFTGTDDISVSDSYYPADISRIFIQTAFGPRNVISINQCVSSTFSSDWVTGSTDMNAALSAFASGGMSSGDFVFVRLGVNDAQGVIDSGTFHTNMISVIGALTGAGYKVLLSYPTYREPGAYVQDSGATTFNDTYGAAWISYFPILDGFVNGTTVFKGDVYSAINSASLPTEYLMVSNTYPGGIHPNVPGIIEQGTNDAIAYMVAVGLFFLVSNAQKYFSINPTSVSPNKVTIVNFTGINTQWTLTPPSFTITGVPNVSIGAVTVINDTNAFASVTSGFNQGLAMILDSVSGYSFPLNIRSEGMGIIYQKKKLLRPKVNMVQFRNLK